MQTLMYDPHVPSYCRFWGSFLICFKTKELNDTMKGSVFMCFYFLEEQTIMGAIYSSQLLIIFIFWYLSCPVGAIHDLAPSNVKP